MSGIRADRMMTVGIIAPLQRALASNKTVSIPMLMYHEISIPKRTAHPYFETSTSKDIFRTQIRYLREQGYIVLTLQLAMEWMALGKATPRTVVITFDDGCRSFYTDAMPILQEYGFPATMFIVSGIADGKAHSFLDTEFMTWPEIREISDASIEIGSHTVSHQKLHRLSLASMRREIEESKMTLEQKLGKQVMSISYPYAFPEHDRPFREILRHAVQNAGYSYGMTTVLGRGTRASDPYLLPRLPVNEYDDLRLFRAKLDGAYDWVRYPQTIYKKLRHPFNNPRQSAAGIV